MITVGRTTSVRMIAPARRMRPMPSGPRTTNASPRIPYTIAGTAARFWMFSSSNRLYQRSLRAYSSR
jgi:hypothetical protein